MAYEVRIVKGTMAETARDSDFLRVCTSADPRDDTVTLATIQRFVAKAVPKKDSPWRIKTLIAQQPMSSDDAIGLATCYARRKHIPVVYTDEECSDRDGSQPL